MSEGEGSRARILCINSGSSSLKVAVFEPGDGDEQRVAEAAVERIGDDRSRLRVRFFAGAPEAEAETLVPCPDHRAALDLVLARWARGRGDERGTNGEGRVAPDEERLDRPAAVGHRVVHGGPRHVDPEEVTPLVLESLRETVPLAPLHLPPALAAIEAVTARLPGVPQVACFDTAFHAGLPSVARRLPIPERYDEVRRYGFHGLSYEYVVSALGPAAPSRLVIAHLGNGASLAAVRDGRSIDTTMGFTPTGGIPMGTRSGDLDPGVLVYLARRYGLSPDALEHLVDRESGLTAMGGSSDMKTLLSRRALDPRAALAVDAFAYAVRKAIGAFAAALGGLDGLVFTGGIGERSPEIRAQACRGLDALGVVLDPRRNAAGDAVISADEGRCVVRVVATDEDRVIARHVRRVLAARA